MTGQYIKAKAISAAAARTAPIADVVVRQADGTLTLSVERDGRREG